MQADKYLTSDGGLYTLDELQMRSLEILSKSSESL
jgi:hypothetical protein